jgi:GxxExxY protein
VRGRAEDINRVSGQIVDSSLQVHSALGPGLLESAYQACLKYELESRGLAVQCQLELPVTYKNVRVDVGYRIDLMVEDVVVVELKAQDKLMPIHEAQLLSYLKLSGKRLGLLLNFHTVHLRDGIKRMVHQF